MQDLRACLHCSNVCIKHFIRIHEWKSNYSSLSFEYRAVAIGLRTFHITDNLVANRMAEWQKCYKYKKLQQLRNSYYYSNRIIFHISK